MSIYLPWDGFSMWKINRLTPVEFKRPAARWVVVVVTP